MTRRGALLFAAMCVIWGVPYLMIRVAVRELSPAVLVASRTGIAVLILLPLAAMRGELRPLVRRWAPLVAFSATLIVPGTKHPRSSSSYALRAQLAREGRRAAGQAGDGG